MKLHRILLLTVAFVLVACQEAPQTELEAAKRALEEARSAEAETFAPEAFETAGSALTAVETELATQNEKLALFRDYERARELITQAAAEAETARGAAVEAKEKARAEAAEALAIVRTALEDARALVDELAACPRPPKGFASDLEALRGRLDGLAAQVDPIEQSLADEDFDAVGVQAEALGEQLEATLTDLRSAKEKIGC